MINNREDENHKVSCNLSNILVFLVSERKKLVVKFIIKDMITLVYRHIIQKWMKNEILLYKVYTNFFETPFK